jgi:hypothetical protein
MREIGRIYPLRVELHGLAGAVNIVSLTDTEGATVMVEIKKADGLTPSGMKDHVIMERVTGSMQAAHIDMSSDRMSKGRMNCARNSVVAKRTVGVGS